MRRSKRQYYPVNDQIRDHELRVIDNQGENLGVITREEALKLAAENELDLVLIVTKAKPPVAKIVDFSKFKYDQQKKEAEQRKGKRTELKELQFKPNIDEHDLNVRIKRAKEFLTNGDKVKFTVKFFGRMKAKKQIGYDKMKIVVRELEDFAEVESGPTMERNFLVSINHT